MPFKLLGSWAEFFCLHAEKSRYSVSFCELGQTKPNQHTVGHRRAGRNDSPPRRKLSNSPIRHCVGGDGGVTHGACSPQFTVAYGRCKRFGLTATAQCRSSPSYLSRKVSWSLCTSSSLSVESKFARVQRQGRWCLGCGPAEGAHGTVTGILFWSHKFCSSSCRYSTGSTRPVRILRHADLGEERKNTWQRLCERVFWIEAKREAVIYVLLS